MHVYQSNRYEQQITESKWDCVGRKNGGEGGIRTREKLAPLRDFQSRPFVHSGTSPRADYAFHYRYAPISPQLDHLHRNSSDLRGNEEFAAGQEGV